MEKMERKGKLYPTPGERVKLIREWENITQQELGSRLKGSGSDGNVATKTISQIETGHKRLTDSMARKIISVFPQYSLSWLLGYDEFPTQKDRLASISAELKEKQKHFHEAREAFNCLIGGKVTFNEEEGTVTISDSRFCETFDEMEYYRLLCKVVDIIHVELDFMVQAKKNVAQSSRAFTAPLEELLYSMK